jgi:hypothetical protein
MLLFSAEGTRVKLGANSSAKHEYAMTILSLAIHAAFMERGDS